MKKLFRTFTLAIMIFALPLFSLAQTPPHPNGGGAPGGGNTPVGGGAPLGGGLIMMMILGAAYGSRKAYAAFRK